MKILVVNDDSIHAPGIAMLARQAAAFGEVWVVAPAQQCSAMSQKLTLRETMTLKRAENFPVRVKAAYALDGTPVDCVKVALAYLMDGKPDIVLSGINNGYNAGFDIAYSATLGAAFEAVRNGIPAIALSAAGNDFLGLAEPWLHGILSELLIKKPEPYEVWNVNFPSGKNGGIQGILRDRKAAPVSMYIESYDAEMQSDGTVVLTTRGRPVPNERIPALTDAEAVRKGYISIGRVRAY